ncbi:putative phosphatase regulatory subunit-domain-containing protein [Cristinia sonorae]|uniref:Phosphatase regulatory subunit-domain-containing protein n=1 Tax=Cristinia sonorae TaxID=1940300 RepID=A0A8K0UP34_9AGAR|nr:putative phosphatase regulatory subunit-domain-containing protein [Cristinia sonorae]
MTSIVCSPSGGFSYTSAFMDRSFSRDSNSAGAPLPRIPRRSPPLRTQSASVVPSSSTLQNLFVTPPPAKLVVQPPTPPSKTPSPLGKSAHREGEDDASSSTSGSETYVEIIGSKSRRTRKQRPELLRPPEESTPTPAVLEARLKQEQGVRWPSWETPKDDTPRPSFAQKADSARLRLNLAHANHASSSTEVTPALTSGSTAASSASATSTSHPRAVSLGRKKSGEPLKSSLKSRRSVVRGDLSVITGALSSKSEPSTPTCIKSVHFDAQLEHVKLFLAEQKPLAVSRDGSPTDDTSGTESDFPSFIFGQSEDERIRKSLSIDVVNLPARVPANADVALESLVLSEDGSSINGRVQVRNIAFEKWVAVRFTFDQWQTTSEVTAKYVESLPEGNVDRFGFSIRLNDMLKRIGEKTLFLAVRYTVAGREIWDNNGGNNFQVKFKVQPPKVAASPSPKLSASISAPFPTMDRAGSPSRMADLKTKLEQVVKGREGEEKTVGAMLTREGKRSPTRLSEEREGSFTLKSGTPLSSRYDFSASLRSPWKVGSPVLSNERPRTNTYPNAMPSFSQRNAFHEKKPFDPTSLTRGSPRIADEDRSPTPRFHINDEDADDIPAPFLSRRRSRNHARGYFDLGISQSSSVRLTPPGTPRSESSLRFNSFPPSDAQVYVSSPAPREESLVPPWFRSGGSEESTPSVTDSGTSESSQDSSPVESPNGDRAFWSGSETGSSNHYDVFLSKFCFYTGGMDSMLDAHHDAALQRSHSASSVEELLSSPNSTSLLSPLHTPTRSSSFDDVATISGSTTPTMHSVVFGSPSSAHTTPVAFVH